MIYFEAGFSGIYGQNHPRVLYNSATRRGTLVGSSEQAGFEAVNAASPFEYNAWKPINNFASSLELTLSSAETINAVGISSHNLGTAGTSVQVQLPDGGGGWTSIGPTVIPTDDRPIGILLQDRSIDNVRVLFFNSTGIPRVGVLYFCQALEFPQRVYVAEGTPFNLNNKTQYRNNRTITGNYVGRSVKRQREMAEAPLSHISETWIEANMTAFIVDAQEYPYFLLPRPGDYPKDIGYKWKEEDINPNRMGVGGNLMEFTL